MFKREHHRRIHGVLNSMNGELLKQASCYFGGGTAVVLALNEYRESVDIDFLCASVDGYRLLRSRIYEEGLAGLFQSKPKQLRDVRMDQYGIRTVLEMDGSPIKFEIVREGRIELDGDMDRLLQVPVLSRGDMFAEKLLANADRGLDAATLSRDLIDLAMMIDAWGDIPGEAWQKARTAYGGSVDRIFATTLAKNSDSSHLQKCCERMQMDAASIAIVQRVIATQLANPHR